jgi:hypothetical protein
MAAQSATAHVIPTPHTRIGALPLSAQILKRRFHGYELIVEDFHFIFESTFSSGHSHASCRA